MNQPNRCDTQLTFPIDGDISVNQKLWLNFNANYTHRTYSHKEMRWFASLEINPENPLEAQTAIDQIEWFITDRKNLQMAVNQSVQDDKTNNRVPFELPQGRQIHTCCQDRLTSHFVEWYQRKCLFRNCGIREYSLEAFERGDYIESRIDGSEQTLNYKGRKKGAICPSKEALKKFVKYKLKDDPTLRYASLWACTFDNLTDIDLDYERKFVPVTDNGDQCLQDKTNDEGPHKIIKQHSFDKYVNEVKIELGLTKK